MMQRLKNRKSPRAKWWDYSTPAAYFVTICTKNRLHLFGEIRNGKMQYSPSGIIANIMWYEIKNHFPCVELDEFVVMPNHVHGIIIIKPPVVGTGSVVGTGHVVVGTGHALSLQQQTQPTLSTIVGSYKSAVTKHCNRMGFPSGWQTRFYDVIIKSEADFYRIQNYIIQNPENWENDDLFKENS